GIKQIDHFGFICRESSEPGISQYACYVFQCASESLVDEIMLTLKQAFSTAAALQNAKTQIKLCEACPMHSLHKLCERIEGLYPPRAKLVIQRHLSSLSDNEQADIFERVQKMKPVSDQEENELLIFHLRQLCEAKQKTHIHIDETPMVSFSVFSYLLGSSKRGPGTPSAIPFSSQFPLCGCSGPLEQSPPFGASRMRGRLGSTESFERCNHLTFDKDCSSGDSPPSTPPASPVALAGHPFPEEDSDSPQFRRRAHTFSHPPSASKKRITFQNGRSQSVRSPLMRQNSAEQSRLAFARRTRSESESSVLPSLPSSFSAPSFLKSLYQSSGKPASPPEGDPPRSDVEKRKRTSSVCSSDSLNAGGITLAPRRISWRQRIFLRVASPMKKSPSAMQLEGIVNVSTYCSCLSEDASWVFSFAASRDELQSRKIKLDYEEVGTCQKDAINIWDKKLLNCRAKIRCDVEDIHTTLKSGVPKSRRGEIWQFLAVQHRVRHRLPNKQQPPDISYKDLLKQLTTQQHAILVDLGRTFPTHPYFSAQLGAGQLSLFNLLKAYSLLDKEVGYCQGISFVAGVLLLHMSEEQAFEMLKFLMYDLGFRKQYRPDMMSLQIQMYQLSRLLHDYHRDLDHHLEENDISPSLYAAPWFLTLFASQFPLGFVARIFDIIFLQGTEVIFKVALCLLSTQEESIMSCETFEGIVEFLKNTLPDMSQPQMEKIMAQVFEMDISKQLHAYEVEYHVLQDELQENLSPCEEIEASEKLERANSQLKRQNMDLLEKLQIAHSKIQGVEANLEEALRRETQMMILIQSLEEEKVLYQKTLEKICSYLPQEALSDCEELLKEVNCHPNKF
ncbi:PREDICTED: TBC1 domain family member 4, partial [Thamnophis sirtalis]|uniref:TBC1 domain family member 4 n=1 Tax=Thamnophis sirtalis TaxID=35019 RepID=A0A6I9YUW0_9SAUR